MDVATGQRVMMTDKGKYRSSIQERIAILGGGVTGLTLARKLSMIPGTQITLLDTYPTLGGNHISVNIDKFTFDIGTFVFSNDGEFFTVFPEIKQFYLPAQPRFKRLTPRGQVGTYPFSLQEYYRTTSRADVLKDIADLLLCKLKYLRKQDVPAFAKYYLGTGIYEKSGLHYFIERFYGVPDVDLDRDFAIKRMSIISDRASLRKFTINTVRNRRHRSGKPYSCLIRPRAGFEVIYIQLQRILETCGVHFCLGSSIEGITNNGDYFTVDHDGVKSRFDRIISTIPINNTLKLIGITQSCRLSSQTLVSLFVKVRGTLAFDSEVFYNFAACGSWKRITVYSSLYGRVDGYEYFGVEVPASDDQLIDIPETFESVIDHLKKHRLIDGEPDLCGWHVLENAYPIYTKYNHRDIDRAKSVLSSFGIERAGRQGDYDYIPSADQAVEKANARFASRTRP